MNNKYYGVILIPNNSYMVSYAGERIESLPLGIQEEPGVVLDGVTEHFDLLSLDAHIHSKLAHCGGPLGAPRREELQTVPDRLPVAP